MKELSQNAQDTLEWLGNFGPTVNVEEMQMKGWVDGDKCYLSAKSFRNMADEFLEIAQWLEDRAAQ